MSVESAIPSHLVTERTRHRRIPDDFAPPYPSFVARSSTAVRQVVMAYLGLQFTGELPAGRLDVLDAAFGAPDGPGHHDRARGAGAGRHRRHRLRRLLGRPVRVRPLVRRAPRVVARRGGPGRSRPLGRGAPAERRGARDAVLLAGRPEGVAVLAEGSAARCRSMPTGVACGTGSRSPRPTRWPPPVDRWSSATAAGSGYGRSGDLPHPVGTGLDRHRRCRAGDVPRRRRAGAAARAWSSCATRARRSVLRNRYLRVLEDGVPVDRSRSA